MVDVVDRRLRGLCAARLTRISGRRPGRDGGRFLAVDGFDDMAADLLVGGSQNSKAKRDTETTEENGEHRGNQMREFRAVLPAPLMQMG